MVSFTLITTLVVGALLNFQSTPVTGCMQWRWDVQAAPKPQPPKCQFNLFRDIGQGIAAVGKGIGQVVHGVGQGLGGAAVGIGNGVHDFFTGTGEGASLALKGAGEGVERIVEGAGKGIGSIIVGVCNCLLDLGWALGAGLNALFHGCKWHTTRSNYGAINIGMPGAGHLAGRLENGPHITFRSTAANGKGTVTFYFTLVQNGAVVDRLSKEYEIEHGSSDEMNRLMRLFIIYCRDNGRHESSHVESPLVRGNIKWRTETRNGQHIIVLTYTQFSGDKETVHTTKTYDLCTGSKEEVKKAIEHFKNELRS